MTSQLRANWNWIIRLRSGWAISLLVLAFGGGALALALAAAWAGLRLNDSPSMPTGLYIRASSESNASLVVFCPADPFARLSVDRGYRSRGNCPDGAEPLVFDFRRRLLAAGEDWKPDAPDRNGWKVG